MSLSDLFDHHSQKGPQEQVSPSTPQGAGFNLSGGHLLLRVHTKTNVEQASSLQTGRRGRWRYDSLYSPLRGFDFYHRFKHQVPGCFLGLDSFFQIGRYFYPSILGKFFPVEEGA